MKFRKCQNAIPNFLIRGYQKVITRPEDIDVSNMGESALKSDIQSKKHNENSPQTSLPWFKPSKPINTEVTSSKNQEETAGTSKMVQNSLDSIVESESVLFAEIRWVLKVVQAGFSLRSCDQLKELFNVMFPGHKIVCGRTKCGYIINHGLAPHFLEVLFEEVKKSPKYVTSFDESLNKMLQKGQMDILVSYWDFERIASTRYFNSEFMGGAIAEQILASFNDGTIRFAVSF